LRAVIRNGLATIAWPSPSTRYGSLFEAGSDAAIDRLEPCSEPLYRLLKGPLSQEL